MGKLEGKKKKRFNFLAVFFGSGKILKAKKSKKWQLKKRPEHGSLKMWTSVQYVFGSWRAGPMQKWFSSDLAAGLGGSWTKQKLITLHLFQHLDATTSTGTSQPGGHKEMSSILADQ
jgi:hypothetical protein